MDYLYLLLSNLEVNRLNSLPQKVKDAFPEKITGMAMKHVAENNIPDYIIEHEDVLSFEEEE
jgi:hypothetical protein